MTALRRGSPAATAAASAADRNEAAVAAFYAAGMRDTPWEQALDALLSAMDYRAATFYAHDRRIEAFDPSRPTVRCGLWHRLDPAGERPYREHYFRLDPRVAYTLAHPGTSLLFDSMYTTAAENRSGEYRAWYRRVTGMEHTLGGHMGRSQPFFGAVTMHRPKRDGASTPAEHARFATLFRHMERALCLEYRLYQAEKASLLSALTDDGPNGVVLFDAAGRVIHANGAMTGLAADGGLRLGRRLGARNAGADAALDRALASALAGRGGETVRVPCAEAGRDRLVMLAPVPRPDRAGLFARHMPAACAVVVDMGAAPPPAPGTLSALLHLSRAEGRLLSALMDGRTAVAAAKAAGLSLSTVRTQLAALFRKTGTTRQVELVQLAHAVVRAVPRP